MTLETAIALREQGKLQEARALLLRLLDAEPDNPSLCYQTAWIHDAMGLEADAISFYQRAIANGLAGSDLAGALLGLGSSYRNVGRLDESRTTLERAVRDFPDNKAQSVFLAMTLHDLGQTRDAMFILLRLLGESSADASIQAYRRAIAAYAEEYSAPPMG